MIPMKMILTTVILVKQNVWMIDRSWENPSNNLLVTHMGRYLITSIVKTFINQLMNQYKAGSKRLL